MNKLLRITVTAAPATIQDLDRTCRLMGRSRSSAVNEAVAEWLQRHDDADADRQYAAAYQREPERTADVAAVAAGATAAWGQWP